ncbi:DUF2959 domain-containing protein [Thermodesulfobacteriota bacterium B35]
MEKVGIHKRDILVNRVAEARDSQAEAQEQFKSALEQFGSVVKLEETDLKQAYDKLAGEYEDCAAAAQQVSERIRKVESVAEALFDEWEDELGQYQSRKLRRASEQQLRETRRHYRQMLRSMHRAEKSMQPVLLSLHDNVLFLKHNLNAQAIGSLRTEFSGLQQDINGLIGQMNAAIEESNRFIAAMEQ